MFAYRPRDFGGGWRVGLACAGLLLSGLGEGRAQGDPALDFGDAPEGSGLAYFTTLANDGPTHVIDPAVRIGALLDGEPDGLPGPGADGDDLDQLNDEDGLTWVTLLIPGSNAVVDVDITGEGYLNAWIDYDHNGDWFGEPEAVIENAFVEAGLNRFHLPIPANARTGLTYARFRYCSQPVYATTGPAPDGEVVDQRVRITRFDFGDAPASFPTLMAADGARHQIDFEIFMGDAIDAEPEGQPTASADGDDLAGDDDEDGLDVPGLLYPGLTASLAVRVSADGYVQGWLDANRNGNWNAVNERVLQDYAVSAGDQVIPIPVPADADAGPALLRLRYSTQSGVGVDGMAVDGEVEDHLVMIESAPLDFGDAPDASQGFFFATRLVDDGARHGVIPGVYMGAGIDPDFDGAPSVLCDGDDLTGADDEDGVTLTSLWAPGNTGTLFVAVSVPGYLQAWIDFNGDGDWGDAGEHVIVNATVSPPGKAYAMPVPLSVADSTLRSRFRFSTAPRLGVTGAAPDGEVEDHRIPLFRADFGDAPVGEAFAYPVLFSEDGAYHGVDGAVRLGALLDAEPNGIPTVGADGEGTDDDGIQWRSPLWPGEPALVDVTVSTGGYLQAWVDFNRDGSWAGEQLATDLAVVPGVQPLWFTVPDDALPGPAYARFRFATAGGVGVGGSAGDGEVEDYAVWIVPAPLPPADPPCTSWLQRPNRGHGIAIQSWGIPSLGPANSRIIRVADDWVADGRAVTRLRWWGSYLNWSGDPALVPASSRPAAFRVTLYADAVSTNAGTPWVPGLEMTNLTAGLLGYGNTNEYPAVVTERVIATSELAFVAPDRREYIYEYTLLLPVTWPVVESQRYWLGVEAQVSSVPAYRWGWCVAPVRDGEGEPAMVRRSGQPAWTNLVYPPAVIPWTTLTNHPDGGQPVDLAFETFARDCPRRASLHPQAESPVAPDGTAAWLRLGEPVGDGHLLGDDLVADGRPVTGLRWRGAYPGWYAGVPGSVTNPVLAPAGAARPLGFQLRLYAVDGTPCQPGPLVTNLFVPVSACGETYLGGDPQLWRVGAPVLHRFTYAVDLREVTGVPWLLLTGGWYWFSVQAVFAESFEPGPETHMGWTWLLAEAVSGCGAVRAGDGVAAWTASLQGPDQVSPGSPHDLAFDLLSDVPGLSPRFEQPAFVGFTSATNGAVVPLSLGDLGSGVQVLQTSTNLVTGPWSDLHTNAWPHAWPRTNWWDEALVPDGNRLRLRIEQR